MTRGQVENTGHAKSFNPSGSAGSSESFPSPPLSNPAAPRRLSVSPSESIDPRMPSLWEIESGRAVFAVFAVPRACA